MSKYFKLTLLTFKKKTAMSLFFAFQLFIVFFATNILISSYNNRYMLYAPYKNMLIKDGYYFTMLSGLRDDNPHITESFSKLKGDLTFMTIYECTPRISEDKHIRILAFDDTVYENIMLPLANGSYYSNADSFAVISPNLLGISSKDTVKLYDHDINFEISGVLTNPTYMPHLGDWHINSDVKLFYKNYALSSEDLPFAIMPYSSFIKLKWDKEFIWTAGAMLFYNEVPTREIYDYNMSILKGSELIIENSELNYNTLNYINELTEKYIPLILLIFLVVIIGLICGVSVQILRQQKDLSVYYLCGMEWHDAPMFFSLYIAIINIIVALLLMIIYSLMAIIGICPKLGLVIETNNFVFSLAMFAVVQIMSSIIPIIIMLGKSPVTLLRRNKQ